jgi:heme oxygenase
MTTATSGATRTQLGTRLKSATGEAHRHAESRELQRMLIQGRLPREVLAAYLGQLLLVHAALEDAVEGGCGGDPWLAAFWCPGMRHSDRLRDDLRAHGLAPERVRPLAATEAILGSLTSDGAAGLVGALYVLEGSMNGNRFIARAMDRPGASDRRGRSYFDPYGADQPARWAAFKAALDGLHMTASAEDRVVEGALRTFMAVAAMSDEVLAGPRPAEAT